MPEPNYERLINRAILEHPHLLVIASGPDGFIRYFNRGAQNLLGYKAEELVGKQKAIIFHDPAEAQRHADELSRQYGVAVGPGREGVITGPTITGQPEEQVWTYIGKDGRRH